MEPPAPPYMQALVTKRQSHKTPLRSAVPPPCQLGMWRSQLIKHATHRLLHVPIPPYLLALAVGELEARELSPRSRVWSEPSMVDAGAYEFADTAKYLEAEFPLEHWLIQAGASGITGFAALIAKAGGKGRVECLGD
eukprot:1159484-Pelagomonas_calceolata.AAC.5